MGSLNDVIKDMNRKCKENKEDADIVTIGLTDYSYRRIPFTSPRMNYMTFGGLPVGKLIEFFGEEHGGKTTTALDIVAQYQQSDDPRKVIWIDAENSLDVVWAQKLGVDTESLIIVNPTKQSAEEIFQFILDAVDTDEVGLWILDSIPSLCSKAELEKEMEEKTYAGISSPLTVFARKVEGLMQKHQCTGIGINQVRDDMNAMWGGAIKTPGGKAWKHFCMVRMQFTKGKYIDDKGNDMKSNAETPAGNYILVSMPKNKSCPPTRRTGFYTIKYAFGVDYLFDLTELAIKYGVIEKNGGWFSIIDPTTGELIEKVQGQSRVYDYLSDEENELVLTMIEDYVESKIAL